MALGNTSSPAAMRALGRALDDEDFDVRFNVVQSLADAYGQVNLRTSRESFAENETEHKRRWRERLAARGVALP